ncbi:hypothetical protein VZT92_010283 [Zoarces viviparus]|uniref:Uncharacterized protein n=1 Tax=Zoarces viviparus TaxID=48416 RepID=A0AAW1FFE7_ZOAVI
MSSATLNMTSPSALTIRTILRLCGHRTPRASGGSPGGQDEETASTQAHRISGRARGVDAETTTTRASRGFQSPCGEEEEEEKEEMRWRGSDDAWAANRGRRNAKGRTGEHLRANRGFIDAFQRRPRRLRSPRLEPGAESG